MKEEIKKEWIKRLRSGAIKQGRKKLGHKDGARCCLGVLCDIAVEHGVVPTPSSTCFGHLVYGGRYSEVLPPEVARWADVQRDVLMVDPLGENASKRLPTVNDTDRVDFQGISELLESWEIAPYNRAQPTLGMT